MEGIAEERDILSFAVPEPGQLVRVRNLQWIVADVDATSVGYDKPSQHLVRLSSISEDALGEEIEVIWEIEPGASVIERAGLPELNGIDDADTLQAFIDAVRWGAATNADRMYLQAPFRSGVSIQDFQLDPLVRAIDMSRTNLLIADDVGLGKTIEAGLIVQEMIVRHRVRTVLVLCPASLQEKWRMEMQEKFGLSFEIIDAEAVRLLRREQGLHANPWTVFPRTIASIDWLKQGEGLRLLKDVIPHKVTHPRKFDLLIVDEAHNVTPSVGKYPVETQRTTLARMLAPHFQHKLFLTATPHNGFTESFTALLELLDDQRFARNVLPDDRKLKQVMVRRLKSELRDKDGAPLYPKRNLEPLSVTLSTDERDIANTLETYIKTREMADKDGNRRTGRRFIHQLLRKRLASSPAAFRSTLGRHIDTLEGRTQPTRAPSKIDDRILRRKIEQARDDYSDAEDLEQAELEAVQEASSRERALSQDEQKLLEKLRNWSNLAANQSSSTSDTIIKWLDDNIRPGGVWSDERVIIFTEYRTTQVWMQEILVGHGYSGDRLSLIHGGMDKDEREKVKAAFQAPPEKAPVRILLATDAASEGIDLQKHCSKMIHLEIPYNPNVMEQRNGRIDRHGQKSKSGVTIYHPVDASGERGEDIMRAIRKLDAARNDGISVNPIIAPQFVDVLDGRRKELDTTPIAHEIENAKKLNRIDTEFHERVLRAREKLDETKLDLELSPERIEMAVVTALRLQEQPPLREVHSENHPRARIFQLPNFTGSWTKCLDGLQDPFDGTIRKVTFDHEVAAGNDDLVLIHLNHPLVQMSLRLLRAEVWALDTVKKINRVSVKVVADDILREPAVVILSRLLITGGGHHRLHEEVTETGGFLRETGFKREDRVLEVRRWMDSAETSEIEGHFFDVLKSRFSDFESAILRAVSARSRERLKTLDGTVKRKREKEIQDIQSVLEVLERDLSTELAREFKPEQLQLEFAEEQRFQIRRDRQALEARLARIPKEKELEVDTIKERYQSISDHTFPAAVVLLCPSSMARGKS